METTIYCQDCPIRKAFARVFDMYFWRDDCPYRCDYAERGKEKTNDLDLRGNARLHQAGGRT